MTSLHMDSTERRSQPSCFSNQVVRVGLVAERGDLHVAGGTVEIDRFDERPVRLQPQRPYAVRRRTGFELGEQATADTMAARGVGNPHTLQVGHGLAMELSARRTRPDGRRARPA